MLGVVFVVLVCFLRRGLIGGLHDLLALLARRRRRYTARERASGGRRTSASKRRLASLVARRAAASETAFAGPVLEARGLTKSFGGMVANRNIDFAVEPGRTARHHRPQRRRQEHVLQDADLRDARRLPAASSSTAATSPAWSVAPVCQLGLTKSYQVNQLFTRLTLRDNIVIAALAERRGTFSLDLSAAHRPRAGAGDAGREHAGDGRADARADVPVAELAYGEKRRLEIGLALADVAVAAAARRAARRDEPPRAQGDGAAPQKHPPRPHTGRRRARHGRGVRAGRAHHRAARRRVARRGHAGRDPAQRPGAGSLSRRAWRRHERASRSRAHQQLLRRQPHPVRRVAAGREERSGGAARPQRRRQEHDAEKL